MATKIQNNFLNDVYLWMTLGLITSGITSYLLISVFSSILAIILQNFIIFIGLFVVELIIVWFLSSKLSKGEIDPDKGKMLFIFYSLLSGITLTPIVLAYTAQSIFHVFFITAGVFGAASIYGYITKRDLSGMGGILFMGLIGLILALLVDTFFTGGQFSFILSVIGVLLFTALTAYDTQAIKQLANHKHKKTLAILGALKLYLDFINLFIFLLRLFGVRRE